ncbi:hypothetical protein N499_0013B, partial [Wolbachia pipientis wVitA]
FERQSH